MGHKDPDRQQAIKAELAEMEPSSEEEFHDFLDTCETEDSRAPMESNEFHKRVARIYAVSIRLGISPHAWFCALQMPSGEECMIRDELLKLHEAASGSADEFDAVELEYAAYLEASRLYPLLQSQCRTPASWWNEQEATIYNRAVYEELSDLWEARNEPLDEWSGPAMPLSAVQNPWKEPYEQARG